MHPVIAILTAAKRFPILVPNQPGEPEIAPADDPTPPAEDIIALPSQPAPVAPPAFSLFRNCKASAPCERLTLREFIAGVRDGRWRAEVEACRAILANHGKEAYNASRMDLPAVSLSAFLKHRKRGTTLAERGAVHSGLLQLDFDAKDHPGMSVAEILRKVAAAPSVVACFLSLSGDGVKAIVRCPANLDTHAGSWLAAEADFAKRGLILDPSTKDACRLCFVSYDPQAFMREDAEEIAPFEVPERASGGDASNGTERQEHVREVLAQLAEKMGCYQDRNTWLHIVGCTVDAVGADAAGEIVDEYFPPLEEWHQSACDVAHTLTGSWLSLRKYLPEFHVDPEDKAKGLEAVPDLGEGGESETVGGEKAARKRLADFLVNHSDTLGLSRGEIDALRPPVIIAGFLRWGEVLLLGAESKSRKSWLAQDAGFCVAAGSPWLADESGANGFATVKARVHVLDLELNPSEMRYRFAKARANRFADSPDAAAAMTASVAPYSLDGLNVAAILPLLSELEGSVEPGDVVIVDCLYRLCPDGNEVAPVAAIFETIKRFAADTKAGVILVDHFRKAGADKARDRFAGSFVKQAGPSTLVAIEVSNDDVLVLNIDARTFYGCPRVHARFNRETYAFNRLPEAEVAQAKAASTQAEEERWILELWRGRPVESAIGAADAAARWGIKRQGVAPRLAKLVARGWLTEKKRGRGTATEWTLTPEGCAIIKPEPKDI